MRWVAFPILTDNGHKKANHREAIGANKIDVHIGLLSGRLAKTYQAPAISGAVYAYIDDT